MAHTDAIKASAVVTITEGGELILRNDPIRPRTDVVRLRSTDILRLVSDRSFRVNYEGLDELDFCEFELNGKQTVYIPYEWVNPSSEA